MSKFFKRLKQGARRIWEVTPNNIRAGVITGIQALVGSLLVTGLGILNAAERALSSDDWTILSNELHASSAFVGSAIIAFGTAVITAVYRHFRSPVNSYKA